MIGGGLGGPIDISGDPSFKGGDAKSSASSDGRFYHGSQGGMFSPMYFGGSGGGMSGVILALMMGVGFIWLLKSR